MPKLLACFLLALLSTYNGFAAATADSSFTESAIVLHTATGDLFGTLTIPKNVKKPVVALIIAGSGPTDRNGNNMLMKNESLRKLAYALANNSIASLRYDKRAIGESKGAAKSEDALRFEDYINDAKNWLALLKKDNRFGKRIVIGHSEGSLIGMVTAQENADAFVSVAGAGRSADKVLKEQLASQSEALKTPAYAIIDSLRAGKTVATVSPLLFSLLRPSVQPYMISWFRYNPQVEIKKLTIPVLLVQGTNDIQVSVEDAKSLATVSPNAQLLLITNMNHIFRIVAGDRKENIATYTNPDLPISEEMVKGIATFTRSVSKK